MDRENNVHRGNHFLLEYACKKHKNMCIGYFFLFVHFICELCLIKYLNFYFVCADLKNLFLCLFCKCVFLKIILCLHIVHIPASLITIWVFSVPAMLEHEAIAGLTASKPAGLRGRSTSTSHELEDDKDALHALDKLMRTVSC